MVSPQELFSSLRTNGISFFAGVPDSLLKDFCAYVTDNAPEGEHVICANEGAAVALAIGHYLATNQPGLVYMQNSGFGNTINPLLSVADPQVYGIPLLMLIGWRGEPGKKDEPQHTKQGRIMLSLLNTLEIPYEIIDEKTSDVHSVVKKICDVMMEKKCPCALVTRAGTFEPYVLRNIVKTDFPLQREDAIKIILDQLNDDDIVVGTTGMTSREIFEHRAAKKQGHDHDFLTVGSMGHASQIALGIAQAKPYRQVYCIDGDGSIIMHMGSLAVSGVLGLKNFKHIVINNGAHDSVGGQPTVGFKVHFDDIAKACGYAQVLSGETPEQITEALRTLKLNNGPSFFEIRVNKGARKDLGRPTTTPVENKTNFMNFLKK